MLVTGASSVSVPSNREKASSLLITSQPDPVSNHKQIFLSTCSTNIPKEQTIHHLSAKVQSTVSKLSHSGVTRYSERRKGGRYFKDILGSYTCVMTVSAQEHALLHKEMNLLWNCQKNRNGCSTYKYIYRHVSTCIQLYVHVSGHAPRGVDDSKQWRVTS